MSTACRFSRAVWVLAIAVASAAACGGCATAPRSSAEGSIPAGNAGPSSTERIPAGRSIVAVYCAADQVPYAYREVGVVSVLGWGRDRETMLRELKERAAAQGAEAVILLDEQRTEGTSLDYSEGTCSVDAFSMRAVAIVTDEDGEDAGHR